MSTKQYGLRHNKNSSGGWVIKAATRAEAEKECNDANAKGTALKVVVIERWVTDWLVSYDPKYGDEVECHCGHTYYRHFDTYEEMEPVGCKYCPCQDFMPNEGKVVYLDPDGSERRVDTFTCPECQGERRLPSEVRKYVADKEIKCRRCGVVMRTSDALPS